MKFFILTLIEFKMASIFIKRMTRRELIFFNIAQKHRISPELLSIQKLTDELFRVIMRSYPQTLSNIPIDERCSYTNELKFIVNKLHNIGICHGNLSRENIVLDHNKRILKLIDFKSSKWIRDVNCSFNSSIEHIKSIEHRMEMELNECHYICCIQ